MAVTNVERALHVERKRKVQVVTIFKYFMGYCITTGFDLFLMWLSRAEPVWLWKLQGKRLSLIKGRFSSKSGHFNIWIGHFWEIITSLQKCLNGHPPDMLYKDNFGGREVGLELVPKFDTVSVSLVDLIRKIHFENYIYFCTSIAH